VPAAVYTLLVLCLLQYICTIALPFLDMTLAVRVLGAYFVSVQSDDLYRKWHRLRVVRGPCS
jgi:hypothetical protein